MYNPHEDNPDKLKQAWLEMIQTESVYRCLKRVSCEYGEFDADTLVTLEVVSPTSGKIRVTDFKKYAERMISSECMQFHKRSLEDEISDIVSLSLIDFEKTFEPVQEFNNAWQANKHIFKHRVNIWIRTLVAVAALICILIVSLFIFPEVAPIMLCIITSALVIFTLVGFVSAVLIDDGERRSKKKLLKSMLSADHVNIWVDI